MAAGGPPPTLPLLALAPVRLELSHGPGSYRDAFTWPASASDADVASFAGRLVLDGAIPPALEGAAMRAVTAAAASWRADSAAGRTRRAAGPLHVTVRVDARAGRTRLRDTFIWDAADESADPEAFAARTADDLLSAGAGAGVDDLEAASRQRDVPALALETALQIREACAAAWRGAPAAAQAAQAALAALAAAGGGEAPAGRADWAEWAPRLDDVAPVLAPPPPPPGRLRARAAPRAAAVDDEEQSEERPAAHYAAPPAAKQPKLSAPRKAAGGGTSGATSAVSLAQRSAAAAAQLGLGPPPTLAPLGGGGSQRLGSLHGPLPPFAHATPAWQLPPPPLPPPQQLHPQHPAPGSQQAHMLSLLSQAFSGQERASVMQALQAAKAAGPDTLSVLLKRFKEVAEQRLGAAAFQMPH